MISVCVLLVLNLPCTLLAVVATLWVLNCNLMLFKKEGILFFPVTISTTHCQLYVDSCKITFEGSFVCLQKKQSTNKAQILIILWQWLKATDTKSPCLFG